MENKRSIWFMKHAVLLIILFVCTNAIQAKVPTPTAVTHFYTSMKNLSKASNSTEVDEITRFMWTLNYSKQNGSASGDGVRNDFQSFTYDRLSSTHNDESLSFETYINRLEEYIFVDRVMNVDNFFVVSNDYYGEAIDFIKGKKMSQNTIVETIVEKTYTINYQTITFRDTLLTHIPTNTICKFYNIKNIGEKDITDLKMLAARFYYLKQYADAYRCLEKILTINSNDGETLYRLGLMTYYGEGSHITSKKLRRNKGKEYMERASRSDVSTGFKDKAEIVLKNWKYGPSLM